MAFLSKNELCELCNVKVKDFSIYVKRGNVVMNGDFIDSNNEINKKFIERRKSRFSNEPKINKTVEQKPLPPPNIQTEKIESSEGQTYTESERQLKYLDTIKRQKEIDKLDIEIQKKRGEVVPSEMIKPIFLQHNQSIITEINNRLDEFIRIFSKKRSLTVEEIADIKGNVVEWTNESMNRAILTSVKGIESVIDEHSEKRGIGEHGSRN